MITILFLHVLNASFCTCVNIKRETGKLKILDCTYNHLLAVLLLCVGCSTDDHAISMQDNSSNNVLHSAINGGDVEVSQQQQHALLRIRIVSDLLIVLLYSLIL